MGQGWQYRIAPPDAAAIAAIDISRDPAPADLSDLDQRIRLDEARLTNLRDAELMRENAVVFAVDPALPYGSNAPSWPRLPRHIVIFDPITDLARGIASIPRRIMRD
jgi:hypothetical protein